jgi:hypothetical protein
MALMRIIADNALNRAVLAYYMKLEQAVLTFVESVAKVLPSVPPE